MDILAGPSNNQQSNHMSTKNNRQNCYQKYDLVTHMVKKRAKTENNEVRNFFITISTTAEKINPYRILKMKRFIFNYVAKEERQELREKENCHSSIILYIHHLLRNFQNIKILLFYRLSITKS